MAKKVPKHIQGIAKQHVTEYLRCKTSFDYFCANYIYIELPGKDALLVPYAKQTELIDLIKKKICLSIEEQTDRYFNNHSSIRYMVGSIL